MEWNPTIRVAGYEVMASGTVVSNGGETVEIIPVNHDFRIRLKFPDQPGKSSVVDVAYPEPGVVEISLTNFGSNGGGGTKSPIEVGNLGDKTLSLSLACYVVGAGQDATRMMHFTLLAAE